MNKDNGGEIFDYDQYDKQVSKKQGKGKAKKNKHNKQNRQVNQTKQVPQEKQVTRESSPQDSQPQQENLLKQDKQAKTVKPPKKKPPRFVPAEELGRTPHKQEKDPRESIESIKKMFGEALDESKEEMAEFTEEQAIPEEPVQKDPEGAKRRLLFFFGIVITVLALIGLYSAAVFTAKAVRDFADNTQQKNEFARFVYPIVICDPAPFNKTVKLRSETLITASIWDIILYEDKSKYEADFDMIIVPELDVEQHGTKLFGTGLSFEHRSIIGADVQFYYDESINSYRIPSNPKYFTYSPFIEDMTRVGERYTLTVGYVSPTPAWLTLTSEEEPKPEKYMEYVVSKRGDEMTLVAIQESPLKSESPHGL